jgi:hypothetical protein
MESTRREFFERMATGISAFGMVPFGLDAMLRATDATGAAQGQQWDLSWVNRLTGKHKAIFDVPEVESGYGVWRASIWGAQYQDVLKAQSKDISTLLILRHNGIALAMQQSFWDKYGVGKIKNVTHPLTLEPTNRNPALLSSATDGIPAQFDSFALPKFIERGGIALACNLAFQDCVDLVTKNDKVDAAEARKRAIAAMVPGVVLQPSGVFAAVRGQEAGCVYVRAS